MQEGGIRGNEKGVKVLKVYLYGKGYVSKLGKMEKISNIEL